jgi:hypothetical protein
LRLVVAAALLAPAVPGRPTVAQVQALYRMAPAKDKQLEIVGGASTGQNGWDLLGGVNGADFTPFATKVADFVSVRTRS